MRLFITALSILLFTLALSQERAPLVKVSGLEMVLIPGGEFIMGSNDIYYDARPTHKVYVDSFYLSKSDITNKQYARFLNDYGKDKDDNGNTMMNEHLWALAKKGNYWVVQPGYENYPVVYVTWFGANQFCRFYRYRLPSEAEWEYTCCRDTSTKYRSGAATAQFADYMRSTKNAVDNTHAAGQAQHNQYGLYDMQNNVWEWCNDWYEDNYYRKSPAKNPSGPTTGKYRILRGGLRYVNAGILRSSYRNWVDPDYSSTYGGFRCVQSK